MKSIEQDLESIKSEILNGFKDPFVDFELKNFLVQSSKFIRSRITLLYLKSMNIKPNENILKIIAAGEIIHSASLLHDDVIDDADFRRNKETFSKLYGPKISILAGDYLVSHAINKLLEVQNFKIIQIMKNCVEEMSISEIKQFFLRNKNNEFESYIAICKGKTASLFSAILESCFVFFNLDSSNAKIFGENVGVYFQLKNDLEMNSSLSDKKNGICTIKGFLGVEKTNVLLDNYKKEIVQMLNSLPNNKHRRELEDLINLI